MSPPAKHQKASKSYVERFKDSQGSSLSGEVTIDIHEMTVDRIYLKNYMSSCDCYSLVNLSNDHHVKKCLIQ